MVAGVPGNLRSFIDARAEGGIDRDEARAIAAEARQGSPRKEAKRGARRTLAKARLDRRQALADNLSAQVVLLRGIRDHAAALGIELDSVLADLTQRLQTAEQLLEASKAELFDIIELLASRDPEAAAAKWLEKEVNKRAKKILAEAGLDPRDYVRRLVERAFPGESTPELEAARAELSAAILAKLTAE